MGVGLYLLRRRVCAAYSSVYQFTAEEKVVILRRHLLDKIPVSELEKKVHTKDEVLAERVIAEFPWCFVIVGQAVLGVAACVLLPCPLQVLLKTALIVAPSC